MPLADNLSSIDYSSAYPIDKIVQEGTISVTNNGNTTAATGTGDGPQQAKIQSTTATNTYGKKCLVRAFYSIDGGVNYNSIDTRQTYSFTITYTDIPVTSPPTQGLKAACSVGVSDSTIYVRTANGFHGNVSTTSGNPNNGYTPTSLTFDIKYALYEVE